MDNILTNWTSVQYITFSRYQSPASQLSPSHRVRYFGLPLLYLDHLCWHQPKCRVDIVMIVSRWYLQRARYSIENIYNTNQNTNSFLYQISYVILGQYLKSQVEKVYTAMFLPMAYLRDVYGVPFSTLSILVCFMLTLTSHHMVTSSNGNIFRVTGPLCGEFVGHRWIPLTKASDAELWYFL